MNLEVLHFKCQTEVKQAYQDYRQYIENAIFNVDDSIIELEMKVMKQKISMKMNTWFYDYNFTEKQYDYMQHVINYYLNIVNNKAINFANKHRKSDKIN